MSFRPRILPAAPTLRARRERPCCRAGECTVHAAAARDYAKELPCTDGARGAKEKESDASAKPSGAAMYPAFDPKVICCRERATSTTSQAVSHFLFS